jgi:predicted O-methyltransferase YrrM
VDIARPDVPEEFLSSRWRLLVADDLSDTARRWVPGGLDLLFIDTSHTYEQTSAELAEYVPRVWPGGTVLLHDTQWTPTGPLPAPDGPVAAALTDYCAREGLHWENEPSVWGMGVIRVPVP